MTWTDYVEKANHFRQHGITLHSMADEALKKGKSERYKKNKDLAKRFETRARAYDKKAILVRSLG